MKYVVSILYLCLLYFNSVAQQIPEYAEILSRYVQYPSEQYQEKEAGLYFMNECSKKGLCTEILTHEDTAFNFVASIYPLSHNKPNIIFLNHMDVVPPGDTSLWIFPPYSGMIKDNYVWGRGAIDNKGMAVAELFALAEFVALSKEEELPFNISILSVSGEETDGQTGAKQISDRFLDKLNAYLILGEGGSGVRNIVRSDPDKIVFGISSVDKSKIILHLDMEIASSGHGSVPPEEYAMKEMIFALEKILKKKPEIQYNRISVKALKTLGRHEKGVQGFVQQHFTFLFFKPFVKREIKKDPVLLSFFANTISFTKLIIPEGTDNMISHNAKAIFDCRLLPGANRDKFINNVNRKIKDKRVKVTIGSEVPSAPRTDNPLIYSHLKETLDSVFPDAVVVEMIFPATTDNNFFREKDIPVYGIFPACFSEEELMSIHNINEKINISALESSILVYKVFLEKLVLPGRIKFKEASSNN